MAGTLKKNTQQIGRAGELLVQFRLLRLGVESAPMTTDSGIDLVAFNPATESAVTVQVKANDRPKPGAGKGKPALDWWIPTDCPPQSSRLWIYRLSRSFRS